MSLGERIKTQREKKSISQERLAKQMNVTPDEISDWETGESLPDVENAVRLSDIFNISLDYLLKNTPAAPQKEWWEMPFTRDDTESESASDADWRAEYIAYPLAMVAYLIMGFAWGMWHPGWLVFTAAWAINDIGSFIRSDRQQAEFYGLASMVFFVMGFFFDLWHFSWLVYVAAAAIEGVAASRDSY